VHQTSTKDVLRCQLDGGKNGGLASCGRCAAAAGSAASRSNRNGYAIALGREATAAAPGTTERAKDAS